MRFIGLSDILESKKGVGFSLFFFFFFWMGQSGRGRTSSFKFFREKSLDKKCFQKKSANPKCMFVRSK